MRQMELATLVQVTGKTDLRRFARIDDGVARAAGLIVNTAGTVAGFTAHIESVGAFRHQLGVRSGRKVPANIFVALGARMRSDKLSARYLRRSYNGACDRRTGKERNGANGCKSNGNGSPDETPVGRWPNVCSVSAHEFRPDLKPTLVASQERRLR